MITKLSVVEVKGLNSEKQIKLEGQNTRLIVLGNSCDGLNKQSILFVTSSEPKNEIEVAKMTAEIEVLREIAKTSKVATLKVSNTKLTNQVKDLDSQISELQKQINDFQNNQDGLEIIGDPNVIDDNKADVNENTPPEDTKVKVVSNGGVSTKNTKNTKKK